MPNSDYDQAKELLKGAREKLQKLAIHISHGVQDLRKVVTSEDWDEHTNNNAGVELNVMRTLLNESIEGLQGAKAKYQQANRLLEGNVKQLEIECGDFDQVSRRLDNALVDLNREFEASHKRYLATANYGTVAGVATTCGIFDIFLTFGTL